jgi:hypothetical protein
MFNTNTGFDMSNTMGVPPGQHQWPQQQLPQVPVAPQADIAQIDQEEGEQARRPPNAFILYSQAMRSQVRQENPSLSNTECSKLLGKMWKEVPNEIKLQYKQKAAAMQEEFKRAHPDYTYRKARRKRALNELLTKSTSSINPALFQGGYPEGGVPQWGMPYMNLPSQQTMQGLGGMGTMPTMGTIPGMNGLGTPTQFTSTQQQPQGMAATTATTQPQQQPSFLTQMGPFNPSLYQPMGFQNQK